MDLKNLDLDPFHHRSLAALKHLCGFGLKSWLATELLVCAAQINIADIIQIYKSIVQTKYKYTNQ